MEGLGTLNVLNVFKGDTTISFDPKDPAEADRAKAIVQDMLKKGYAILIQVGEDEKGPTYRRVKKFDPETCEYIIAGDPPKEGVIEKAKKSLAPKRIKAKDAKGVVVARSAGG